MPQEYFKCQGCHKLFTNDCILARLINNDMLHYCIPCYQLETATSPPQIGQEIGWRNF